MYVVMSTNDAKEDRINIRIEQELKDEVRALARLRHLSLSALICTTMGESTKDEKKTNPLLFADALTAVKKTSQRTPKKTRLVGKR